MNKVLIYDSQSSTHLSEYIEYLSDYFKDCPLAVETEYWFLINKRIFDLCFELIKEATKHYSMLKFECIDDDIQSRFDNSKVTLNRSTRELLYLSRYMNGNGFTHIVFLQIDAYLLHIGLMPLKGFKDLKVKGILFSPYTHSNPKESCKDKWGIFRKRMQVRVALLNENIEKVFIFNDEYSVNNINKQFNTNKFEYIADPIKQRVYKPVNIRKLYNIPSEKKIVLFAGGIQRRKNILRCIEVLNSLENQPFFLLILGRCGDELLKTEITEHLQTHSSLAAFWNNSFVSNDELESAFATSDLIWLVYQDFFSSSGILGNAAKHGKCTIACKEGVIGRITSKYGLGVVVDSYSKEDIKRGIKKFEKHSSTNWMKPKFLDNHTFIQFAKSILMV